MYDDMLPPATTRKFHVVYLVFDVSHSMRRVPVGEIESPFDRFQILMPDLGMSLRDDIEIRSSCWMSVLAFATTATTVLPAVALHAQPSVPPLPGTGETNYLAVLELLRDRIMQDRAAITAAQPPGTGTGVAIRPLIFLITDGRPCVNQAEQPREVWLPARKELTDSELAAQIAAIGLPGAAEDVLADLATGDGTLSNAFIAEGVVTGTELADRVIAAIKRSVKLSTVAGKMVIKTPPGMRRIGGVA